MNNNNFLWEAILSDFKNDLSPQVIETWFMHSSIENVDFNKKTITIMSSNSLISNYLKSVFDSKIKEALKNSTTINFEVFYNYLENDNVIEDIRKTSLPKKEDPFADFFLKDKPSGMQGLYSKQSFNLDEVRETPTPYNYTLEPSNKNPGLKKHFTFDNFVIGEGNRYAHAAAQTVANYPGQHNPLFIYGGVGLGKTHLLHAIGNELEKENPDFKIECISSEKFFNEFISSINAKKTNKNSNLDEVFREKYRNVDALLIDDIQFFAKKSETQNAFYHTFNELHLSNKQIVLVSDRTPSQLDGLEDRLISRFSSGAVVDITPPDYETRTAIIKFKCEKANIHLDNSIISYISGNITSNIRELEGILQEIKLLIAQNISPTIEIIEQILKRRVKINKRKVSTDDIINVVSSHYNISVQDILSSKRNKEIVLPRMTAIYLCRELTDLSLPAIGKLFNKDHSSIFYSNSKMATLVSENDNNIVETIEKIKEKINNI